MLWKRNLLPLHQLRLRREPLPKFSHSFVRRPAGTKTTGPSRKQAFRRETGTFCFKR